MILRRRRQDCRISNTDEDSQFLRFETNHDIRTSFNLINSFMHWNKSCLDLFQEYHENFACFLTNKSGQIMYVNKKWETICVYSASEVIGKRFDFLQGIETNLKECRLFNQSLEKNGTSTMEVINYDGNRNAIFIFVEAHRIDYQPGFTISEESQPYYWAILKKK